jgi:GNAT superfamily N-acetyltransferase
VDDGFIAMKINVRISLHLERAVAGFVDLYYDPEIGIAMIATNRFGCDEPVWLEGSQKIDDGDIKDAAIAINPDPQFRRRKIGVTLLATAYQAAQDLGAKEIRVNPANNMNAAIFWDAAVREKIIMKDSDSGYALRRFSKSRQRRCVRKRVLRLR